MNGMRSLLGLAVVSVALLGVGCGPEEAAKSPVPEAPKVAMVAKGTPVEFMMMAPVESGDCKPGTLIPMIVADDVKVDGYVVIPSGTSVFAEVSKSRAAGALSAMLNEPARLEVKFQPIEADGYTISFSADGAKEEPIDYAFTRDNTGKPETGEPLDAALKNAATRKLLEELSDALETGRTPDDLAARIAGDAEVGRLLDQMALGRAKEMVSKEESPEKGYRRLLDVTNTLREGDLSKLAGADVALAIAAVEEIGGLANRVNGTLKGIFKGRNIRAHIGTRVRAYVHEDVQVPLKR